MQVTIHQNFSGAALRAGEHRTEWTPDAAATLSKIRESLRPGGPQ